jgi:hypothetical protein
MAPKEKVSLSLDQDLLAEVRRRVGKRELSSFLNDALERRLQADAIHEYLGEAEARVGPVPADAGEAADEAYARRFDRARVAKLRRRIVDAFAKAPAVRAEIEAAMARGDGVDLLGLQRWALTGNVLLELILGRHPRVVIDGQTVRVIDMDPRLDKHAAAS